MLFDKGTIFNLSALGTVSVDTMFLIEEKTRVPAMVNMKHTLCEVKILNKCQWALLLCVLL